MAKALSSTATHILRLIAEGCTYNQIVARIPGCACEDIFNAAAEALSLAEETHLPCSTMATARSGRTAVQTTSPHSAAGHSDHYKRVTQRQTTATKAYARWMAADEAELARMAQAGIPVKVIARTLQRKAGAIRSRLAKLGIERVADTRIEAVIDGGSAQP